MTSSEDNAVDSEIFDVNTYTQEYSEMTCSRELMSTNMEQDEDRSLKRNREMDRNEIWTTVMRKGKRFARVAGDNDLDRVPEDIIEVCVSSATENLPRQFKLAKMLKSNNIQDVIKIKYIH
ncbi:uncharacterized protein LOC114361203 [Ostrinia furnacalis]|uniref:uncharacterized protein LOC114361203 n=1 Tax=Ostrinia furnacalis TaxID=93504 RepID=UPI001039D8C4|nr:uncharacterized protein LOC114361203 [Ostrinia furnacalis]